MDQKQNTGKIQLDSLDMLVVAGGVCVFGGEGGGGGGNGVCGGVVCVCVWGGGVRYRLSIYHSEKIPCKFTRSQLPVDIVEFLSFGSTYTYMYLSEKGKCIEKCKIKQEKQCRSIQEALYKLSQKTCLL